MYKLFKFQCGKRQSFECFRCTNLKKESVSQIKLSYKMIRNNSLKDGSITSIPIFIDMTFKIPYVKSSKRKAQNIEIKQNIYKTY